MHIPVLLEEVVELLDPKPNENFIDCTFGWGGHSRVLLDKILPAGRVLGLELDQESIAQFLRQNPQYGQNRLILESSNFSEVARVIERHNFGKANGILFDLGMSSWHVDESTKGFSFLKDEPLDMRYSSKQTLAARQIVNVWDMARLEKLFREYGQERFSRPIAKRIMSDRQLRPIESTKQLVDTIAKAVPTWYRRGRTHFATRVFQALRIGVNAELDNIALALPQGFDALAKGGRMVVISFHSLEDRIVKNFFRQLANEGRAQIITQKPITPQAKELAANPRSRSAKLRAVRKVAAKAR